MQRLANDGTPLKLSWEEVLEKFHRLIKFAAKQQVLNSNNMDGMISAEDLYQEGMIKLYDCWKIWCLGKNKDMDEFAPIFKTSLFRCVQKGSTKKKPMFVDIDDPATVIRHDDVDSVEKLYKEESIKKLMDTLSDVGKSILRELISPSEKTLFEVWADIERKKMLKSQGKRVNVPKDNTVRMKHIIRSLGITQKQYDISMAEIKRNARTVLVDFNSSK